MFETLLSETPREREIFKLVVSGMLNKQVAYDLGITERTIKEHRAQVMLFFFHHISKQSTMKSLVSKDVPKKIESIPLKTSRMPYGTNFISGFISWSSAFFASRSRDFPFRETSPMFTFALASIEI